MPKNISISLSGASALMLAELAKKTGHKKSHIIDSLLRATNPRRYLAQHISYQESEVESMRDLLVQLQQLDKADREISRSYERRRGGA